MQIKQIIFSFTFESNRYLKQDELKACIVKYGLKREV